MLKTHNNDQELVRYLLKMPKEQSSFLYFLLEGHDNLCFYSTLPHQTGDKDRQMELFATIEFKDDLDRLWENLKDSLQLEVISLQVVKDK